MRSDVIGARRMRRSIALLAALSFVAAGCGDDDGDGGGSGGTASTDGASSTTRAGSSGGTATSDNATSTSSEDEPEDVDSAGVLRFGERLVSSGGVHFDPTTMAAPSPNILWMELVYGTLMREADDGSIEPWMAEGAEVVDSSTVRITLRPGVTFTDGAAYDAEAVKTSLMRTLLEAGERQKANQPAGFKAVTSIDVIDPLTVEFRLSQPIAPQLLNALASNWGAIQSPKQIAENPGEIDTKPVGAGPYMFEEFRPEQLLSLRKNADFWNADAWRLGGIDIVHTPYGPQQVNGLLADALDFAPVLPTTSFEAVESDARFETIVNRGAYTTFLMCTGKEPLDSEALRLAIQVGVDRDEYNDLAYGGLGEVAYSFFPEGHPLFEPDVKELLSHDQDRAKKLLADAGLENVTVDVYYAAAGNYDRQAEIVQAQLAKVGITANVLPTQDLTAGWVEPKKPGMMLTLLPVPSGYELFTRHFQEGGAQAYCGVTRPDVMNLVDQAVALPADDPKAVELYGEAQRLVAEHAYTIPLVYEPSPAAWNASRVGGEPTFIGLEGRPRLRFETIYIKK